jgi:hypothetical protein
MVVLSVRFSFTYVNELDGATKCRIKKAGAKQKRREVKVSHGASRFLGQTLFQNVNIPELFGALNRAEPDSSLKHLLQLICPTLDHF